MINSILILILISIACPVFSAINIAPYSEIISVPYIGETTQYLVDGIILSKKEDNTQMLVAPLPIRIGNSIKVRYEFTLPDSYELSHVRIYQLKPTAGRNSAKSFVISIDTDNNGICDKTIVTEDAGKTDMWQQYHFSDHPIISKLCFLTNKLKINKGPNYGGPVISEFEIYINNKNEIKKNDINTIDWKKIQLLEDSPESFQKIDNLLIDTLPNNSKHNINRGVLSSMWLYWNPDTEYSSKRVNKKIHQLTLLGATHLWLYPHAYSNKVNFEEWTKPADRISQFYSKQVNNKSKKERIMSFPNRLLPASKINILKKMTEQLHENNINIIVNESILPIDSIGWTFPRIPNATKFPSLCSDYVRKESRHFYKSIVDSDIDGLVLGGDEFFLYDNGRDDKSFPEICKINGLISDKCKPTCSELFYSETGKNTPTNTRDYSKTNAQWKIFRYRMIAKWFLEYKTSFTDNNNNLTTTTLLRPGEYNKTDYGAAYDIIGNNESIDIMSSDPYWSNNNYLGHYYFANEVKKLLAANNKRKAEVTLQATPLFTNTGYEDPLMLVGPVFSSVMHGATGINFYRQDLLFSKNIYKSGVLVSKIFKLLKYINQLGFSNPQNSKDVAILYSRASEDWWRLKNQKNVNKSVQAHIYQNSVLEVMFREGVDFDLFYLDNNKVLNNLEDYKIVIIPFPYSITKNSIIKIKYHLEKGINIVVFNSRGEVDELGIEYPEPRLAFLNESQFKNISIDYTTYIDFKNEIFKVLDSTLDKPYSLVNNRNGHDIECNILRHQSNNDIMLICINWDIKSYPLALSLKLPYNNYKIDKITLDGVVPLVINGNSKISSTELENFNIQVSSKEFFILHINNI